MWRLSSCWPMYGQVGFNFNFCKQGVPHGKHLDSPTCSESSPSSSLSSSIDIEYRYIQLPCGPSPPPCVGCWAGWSNGWSTAWLLGANILQDGAQMHQLGGQIPPRCGPKSFKIEVLGGPGGLLGGSWGLLGRSWGALGPSWPQDGPKSFKNLEKRFLVPLGSQVGGQNKSKSVPRALQKVITFWLCFGWAFENIWCLLGST